MTAKHVDKIMLETIFGEFGVISEFGKKNFAVDSSLSETIKWDLLVELCTIVPWTLHFLPVSRMNSKVRVAQD